MELSKRFEINLDHSSVMFKIHISYTLKRLIILNKGSTTDSQGEGYCYKLPLTVLT